VLAPPSAASTSSSASGSNGQQLNSDVDALQTELQSLATKSGLAVADLENLAQDSQSLEQGGAFVGLPALTPVISELATAVAGGTSTSQAQSDWNALFTGTTVSTTVITNTFNDLVSAIRSSNVTTTDMTTVATDEAAIQNDLKNLFPGSSGNTGSGSGSGSGSSSGSGSGSGSTNGGSATARHTKPTPVEHRLVTPSKSVEKAKSTPLHTKATKTVHRRV
jgi:hypothetical protein